MANLSSVLFFNCQYIRLCRRGILALPNEIWKLSCTVPNVKVNPCLASLVKYSSTYSKNKFEYHAPVQNLQFSLRIEDLRLSSLVKEKNVKEGLLMNTFLKFIRIYHAYKGQRGFNEKLKFYLESPAFIQFFELIDKNLNKFSGPSLLYLYDLILFQTPKTEALLDKVFQLLGENLLTYSVLERLKVYIWTVQKFKDVNKCKDIIEICEDYFEKKFQDDLEYEKFTYDMVLLLEANELPLHIRKLIAEKLADDAINQNAENRSLGYFVKVLVNNPDLLPKNTFLKLLHVLVTYLSPSVPIKIFCKFYSNLVVNDDSLYQQEIVDIILENMLRVDKVQAFAAGHLIFKLRYLDDDLVKTLTDALIGKERQHIGWQTSLTVANAFTQISAQEYLPESIFEECKSILEDFDFIPALNSAVNKSKVDRPVLDISCSWLSCITYLGCDSKASLSKFFADVKNYLIDFKSLRELKLLHHLAKASFPSYQPLDSKTVERLIYVEFRELQSVNLDECFAENCFIKNCISSDQHFLHYVALLGPDRKPMNLSRYIEKQLSLPPKTFFNVSEINIPPGCKLIAFQKYVHAYANEFRNVPKKCGFYIMYKKAFENAGCDIVLLPPMFFNSTLEDKKKFLNKEINEIFGVNESSK